MVGQAIFAKSGDNEILLALYIYSDFVDNVDRPVPVSAGQQWQKLAACCCSGHGRAIQNRDEKNRMREDMNELQFSFIYTKNKCMFKKYNTSSFLLSLSKYLDNK